MGYLVLIGVIFVVVFFCAVVNNSKKNKRLSQRDQEQIDWHENNDLANQLTWLELPSNDTVTRPDFLDSNAPDDIENILSDVIGTKDPYTQEPFEPRQRVYLCRRHRLAYHEDTWTAIERKCLHCLNAEHTALYVLPTERSSSVNIEYM